MNYIIKYIFLIFLLAVSSFSLAQENKPYERGEEFLLKGVVKKKDSWEGVDQVQITTKHATHTKTDKLGEFKINVALNDEVTFSHPSFKKVTYKVTNKERLTVLVEEGSVAIEEEKKYKQPASASSVRAFNEQLNLAKKELKKDAATSIDYVSEALRIALENDFDKSNIARAYHVLGDIYHHWKQFDLAISNYKLSVNFNSNGTSQLALAKAYHDNKEYQLSIQTLKSINTSTLSNYQKVLYYELLGDANVKLKQYAGAENHYRKGLKIAEQHLISPKVTDLNSKLGDVFAKRGNVANAEVYYNSALELAENENLKRSIEESDKVADFLSSNNQFDKEIQLRKKNLVQVNELPKADSIFGNGNLFEDDEHVISSQRLNYKIGDAYFKQNKLDEAIPYLEKSIEEANAKEDLVVEKDATRKLSEVYENKIDFVKAYEVYQDYVALVEKLYIKKEQEIVQASRFAQRLANSQNRITTLEKDRELTEGKINLAIKDSQLAQESNKRQQIIIYAMLIVMLLLALLAYYMYRNVKQQKLNNNLLALKQLRSQMNPHFIFNALNSVNSFIATSDERTANRYLSEFSQLMRSVLENSEEDFIPLSKEIELLSIYTKLEHFRFQDKFDYNIIVSEEIPVHEYQIPPMLLQPYVENAVWHGLRYKENKGLLEIEIQALSENELQIRIEDDGIGRARSKALKTQHQKRQQSKGMGNIEKRLAILNEMYNDKISVIIIDKPDDTGTQVLLTLKKTN